MISKFIFNNHFLWNDLPEQDKKSLKEVMQIKKYRKSEAIFTEGTLAAGIFFVQTGKIKKYKADNFGREQIIYIYNSGEFFGYSAVLGEEPYGDTTVAIEPSIISFIEKEDFLRILSQSDVFSRLLLKCLSHEFIVMANLLAVLSQRTVRERVALCLVILDNKYRIAANENEKVYITLSRRDLANMAGTANETLARVLHDFKEEKLIWMEGRRIRLVNTQLLMHAVNI
ncbi:Crp/Fnr family transcriptional regulator [Flavobacterium zhairuonense]|uniref:Crp/Fnr family transcriptional regulator n=1 Tax=Flavobacterium zhairuonense TaxID=2493631 RepID=UPI00104AA053|nr:Crp/Fnr family transcriptional regulator [Flavobacterium zhairuonense]KAF2508662.1 Crp/Fnr family transcriptional regulator [Flavobacterium zhairuonense]